MRWILLGSTFVLGAGAIAAVLLLARRQADVWADTPDYRDPRRLCEEVAHGAPATFGKLLEVEGHWEGGDTIPRLGDSGCAVTCARPWALPPRPAAPAGPVLLRGRILQYRDYLMVPTSLVIELEPCDWRSVGGPPPPGAESGKRKPPARPSASDRSPLRVRMWRELPTHRDMCRIQR